MRKKREFTTGAFYHVTSRTNDKIRVFENNMGRKIMLITLQDAKDKFGFRLTNFCVMPTHIHLLIKPEADTNLSAIMHWIKLTAAKRWNAIHGSIDHLWGARYFARAIRDPHEYAHIMNYIDQNPVVAELAPTPEEWKASGAFYKVRNLQGLVDLTPESSQQEIKQLPPMPFVISRLIPVAQLEHISHYIGAYTPALDKLYKLLNKIPPIGSTRETPNPKTYLHYYTSSYDYYIYEYDGDNAMYGKVTSKVYPVGTALKELTLSELTNNRLVQLEVAATRSFCRKRR